MNPFKRFLNKNARPRPQFAEDYTACPMLFTNADRTATIHACMDRIASEFASLKVRGSGAFFLPWVMAVYLPVLLLLVSALPLPLL